MQFIYAEVSFFNSEELKFKRPLFKIHYPITISEHPLHLPKIIKATVLYIFQITCGYP